MTTEPLNSALSHIDQQAVSDAVRIETRNREQHLPPISVYRWWARRTEAVNGALLHAVSRELGDGLLVADPFVGGGVIALAALNRGHSVYAQDLNPWVAEGLLAMLSLPSPDAIARVGEELCRLARPLTVRAYGTTFSDGAPAELSQSLRVVKSRCSGCGHSHRLFPHALVTLKRRKERARSEAFLACRNGHLFEGDASTLQQCPECRIQVDPAQSYQPGRVVTCPQCQHRESLHARSSTHGWEWELVLVERSDGKRRELGVPTASEVSQSDPANWNPKRRLGAIPEATETRVLRRHGFSSWSDLYPNRQRYVLEKLLALVPRAGDNEASRRALTMAILGTAEMAGYLSRWDRFYLKSYESMASHRFNLTTLAAEPNVIGVGMQGRGTLRRRLRLFEKAADWFAERSIDKPVIGRRTVDGTRILDPRAAVNVVSGNSETLLLPDESVDVILTDPPYHDDVQYHELSLPLRAWAKLTRSRLMGEAVAIPHSARLSGHRAYRGVLQRVFCELRRVLKPNGRLLFSYANREPAAWVNLFAALRSSGFRPIGYTIVHSENESDHAKRKGRACNLDLILELVSERARIGPQWRPRPLFGNDEEKYLLAVGEAFLKSGHLVNGWEGDLLEELRSHRFVRQEDKTPDVKGPSDVGMPIRVIQSTSGETTLAGLAN
jgi:putative DNA methylase